MRNKLDYVKLVSAFVIGDGCLSKIPEQDGTSRHGKPANSRYSLTQIAAHKDYVEWQASVLEDITSVKISLKESWIDTIGTKRQDTLYLKTQHLPFFTTLYYRWYNNGKKVLSLHDIKLLDWQMAAVLYMDDGNLSDRGLFDRITLCTDSFSEADNLLLRNAFAEKLGVHFNIYKLKGRNNFYYRLSCSKDNAERFLEGVSKYIFPSFHYKLGRIAPERDDDIVCSSQECEVSAEMTELSNK